MNKNLAAKINGDSPVENFVYRQTKHSVAILYHALSVAWKIDRLITDTICGSYKNERGESGKFWAKDSDEEWHVSLKTHFANKQPISIWPTGDQLPLGPSNADFLGSLSQSLGEILRRAVGNQLFLDSGCDSGVKGLVWVLEV